MLYTDSPACHLRRDGVGGANCSGCRSSSRFRASLSRTFELPSGDIDFDCPHGKGPVLDPGPGKPPSRGLGDTIAKVTKAVGIKPCPACKRRQEKLNQLIPYKERPDGVE